MSHIRRQSSSNAEGMEIRDWNLMAAELLFIYDDKIYHSDLRRKKHLDDYAAILIREGQCTIETKGTCVTAAAGEWIFPPRQGNRWQVFTAGSHILSIHFQLSWPGGVPVYDWGTPIVIPSSEIPELEERGKLLEQIATAEAHEGGRRIRYSKNSISSYFYIQSHFLQWLEAFTEALASRELSPARQGKIDPRVLKIVQLLDRHPFHISLSQSEIAMQVNLSTNQLTRLFKEQFRMTPTAYFDQRRGREAYIRVHHSKDSIKEIAYDLGFCSPSYFTNWFTHRFHQSPREVRAQSLKT